MSGPLPGDVSPGALALSRLVVELLRSLTHVVGEIEARYASREPLDDVERAQLRRMKGARYHLEEAKEAATELAAAVAKAGR